MIAPRRLAARPALRVLAFCASLACALIALAAASAAPAHALKPWWHLSAGTRPSYLQAPSGKAGIPGEDEVQEIKVPLSEFEGIPEQGALGLFVAEKSLGEFATEPLAEAFGFPALSAANLKSALEAPYGKSVQVSEETKGGVLSFRVSTPPGVEAIEVIGLGLEEPSVEVTDPGKAGTPAEPGGELYMTAENLGDANVDGAKAKVTLRDVLPKGLKAIEVAATKPFREGDFQAREPIPCTLEEEGGRQIASCTMSEALAPYDQLEMRVAVLVQASASSSEANEVSVSGAAAAATLKRNLKISSEAVPFGVESYEMAAEEEGGAPSTQAGAHPFQLTTALTVNQLQDLNPLADEKADYRPEVTTPALARNLSFKLPAGLIGNATTIPKCTTAQFFETLGGKENRCPAASAVGVAVATVHEPATVGTVTVIEPIFNLEPREGEPARFGFYVVIANSPVFIDTSVRSGSDYGVTVNVQNITQTASFLSSEVTFWGVPGDARHDGQRGWGCIYQARGAESVQPCAPAEEQHPKPFLSLPSSCARGLATSVRGDSWQDPGSF